MSMRKKLALAAILIGASGPMVAVAETARDPATKSETAQYATDAAVTAKVKTALLAEKKLKSTDISVETNNGIVQLSGFVVSSAQIDQAEDVTKHVKGVKEVKNDLQLKSDSAG